MSRALSEGSMTASPGLNTAGTQETLAFHVARDAEEASGLHTEQTCLFLSHCRYGLNGHRTGL